MADFNKQIILGHLGEDAEIKDFGTSYLVVLKVATNYDSTVNGETRQFTEWHKVEVWGDLGRLSSLFKKGHHVYVEGPTLTKSWEDSKGNTRSQKIIRATSVSFLGFGGSVPSTDIPGPT